MQLLPASLRRRQETGGAKSSVIYIICLLGLAALAGLLWAKNQSMAKELTTAKSISAENANLKTQVAELDQLRVDNQRLQEMSKDHAELLKLRSEVSALRPLRDQLSKLQAESAQLRSSLQQSKTAAAAASQLRNQNQQLQGALAEQQQVALAQQCIQNLSAIQAAKLAWAQQKNRPPTDVPPDIELFGPNLFLPQKPACPAGGAYTVGAVQQNVTCTIPGHSL